jgi:hypothetical protein
MEKQNLSETEIMQCIINYNNDLQVQRLLNYYNDKSFPEILSVGRKELNHSSFLAWLLDNKSNHNLGYYPIQQLLEIILQKMNRQSTQEFDFGIKAAILTQNILFGKLSVFTEYSTSHKGKNIRPDMFINCDVNISNSKIKRISIIIENKVLSNEHDKQTQSYYEYFNSHKQDNEFILYVYLTPKSSTIMDDKKDCVCTYFIHIYYQDILDHILQPALKRPNISERIKFILTEYIQCLSIPFEDKDNKNKKKIIMAISENERKLLTAFWEKNETLIIAAMEAIATDDNRDDDIKDSVSTAFNLLNKSNRDFSKYSINNKGNYNKRGLVYNVIKEYICKHPETTVNDLKETFPDNLQGSLGVIRKQDEINDYTRYKEYVDNPQLENGIFFICNQWGKQIKKFIKHVEDNFGKDIHIEKIPVGGIKKAHI